MKLADAKKLRDEIRAYGIHCIVPLGFKPDQYFARIFVWNGTATVPKDFATRRQWRVYRKVCDKERRERAEWVARHGLGGWPGSRPRSPIELMIDRACGLA